MATKRDSPSFRGIGPLLVVFAATRLLAVVLLRPGGYFGDWNDYHYFKEMAELSSQGYYPYVHYWVEYPPVFPWLLVGAYRLSLLMPVWKHPMLWFQLPLSAILLLSDVGNLWLIRRIGGRLWGGGGGLQCAWLYAGLFLPLYALSAWFDTLSVFCLLLGLELLLQRRPALAGLACGVGVAVKLFPGLLVPIAVRALRGVGSWVRFAVAAALVPVAVVLPFYVVSPSMVVASLRGMANRRSWESVWALLDGYYGTGGVPALADRLLYTDSALWQTPTRLPWAAITAAFALVYLAVWWSAGRTSPLSLAFARKEAADDDADPRATVALTGFTVALFLLYSRGFSQQYTLLLLPFVVLLAPTVRGALFTAALMANNTLVEGYVWVNVFPDDRWLLRATVGIRTLLLALFAVEAASALLPRLASPWRRVKPAATWALAGLTVALAALGGYRLGAAYYETSAARSPYAAAIGAVDEAPPDAALLFTDERLYAEMYPYTRPRPAHVVADARLPERVGPASLHARLTELVGGRQEVLLVDETSQAQSTLADALGRWLRRNYQPAGERVEAGVRLRKWLAAPARAFPEPAVFGEAIALDWGEVVPSAAAPGQEVRVLLDWRALSPVQRDYTVFAHLLDDAQRIVAQRDSQPLDSRYPTSGWRPGERVPDEVAVALPSALPPGDYYVAVGLYYLPTLERLPVRGGPGGGDRVLLGPVGVEARR